MPSALPAPVAAYLAAKNKHDVDAMLAPFAEEARVKDERKERIGRAAIRAWLEETTHKYNASLEVIDVSSAAGQIFVIGRVSGDFPGSPVDLRYAFNLAQERITGLDITLA